MKIKLAAASFLVLCMGSALAADLIPHSSEPPVASHRKLTGPMTKGLAGSKYLFTKRSNATHLVCPPGQAVYCDTFSVCDMNGCKTLTECGCYPV